MSQRWGDSRQDRESLDRHITGNYGEDQYHEDQYDPCYPGHSWDGATYTTTVARFTWSEDGTRCIAFVQERVCNRCGHPVTHIRFFLTNADRRFMPRFNPGGRKFVRK